MQTFKQKIQGNYTQLYANKFEYLHDWSSSWKPNQKEKHRSPTTIKVFELLVKNFSQTKNKSRRSPDMAFPASSITQEK